jgi:hypothetical protein
MEINLASSRAGRLSAGGLERRRPGDLTSRNAVLRAWPQSSGSQTHAAPVAAKGITMPTVPNPLTMEHQELHGEIARLVTIGGRVGAAATRVAELLQAHFGAEEAFALPPLGALASLARGRPVADSADVLRMTEQLKTELPRMLAEHQGILTALDDLAAAADEEGHPEAVRFAEKLRTHARMEEEVLYPAAILVGEYLRKMRGPDLARARWPDRIM